MYSTQLTLRQKDLCQKFSSPMVRPSCSKWARYRDCYLYGYALSGGEAWLPAAIDSTARDDLWPKRSWPSSNGRYPPFAHSSVLWEDYFGKSGLL